jgi:predicted TIM-barrel fold metal-dependent hydrolase
MKAFFLSVVLLAALDCKMQSQASTSVSGGFTPGELRSFTALEPIDTHTHVRRADPAFNAMLDRLHVHLLDIILVDDLDPEERNLQSERENAVAFIRSSKGHAVLCTTIDPYKIGSPDFAASAIRDLDNDFANGAVAVKLWKNVGMEIRDAKGNYIFPNDPALAPIYRAIAAHNRTLVAHVADPDSAWAPLDPASPDYSYYSQHSEWYMHDKANVPSKERILAARDHVLDQNPKLRVVGAHLGSMEASLSALADHLDRYPNFAVDLASRVPYLALAPRDQAIEFILKYQDRLIYATDLTLQASDHAIDAKIRTWEETYAREWRFLATNETVQFETVKAQGLALPNSVLRKIYHDNAVRWFPGIIPSR